MDIADKLSFILCTSTDGVREYLRLSSDIADEGVDRYSGLNVCAFKF
jgi:hypothetical protein